MIKPNPDPIVFLNKKTSVDAREITLMEAQINYTVVHFEEKRPLMVATTLKKIESIVKDLGFLRIHKKFLINRQYLDSSLLKNDTLILQNNVSIRVSRRKRGLLLQNLKEQEQQELS